jgi:hypothetical protein
MYEAHLGAGEALDLRGDLDVPAEEHFNKAIDVNSADLKQQALTLVLILVLENGV